MNLSYIMAIVSAFFCIAIWRLVFIDFVGALISAILIISVALLGGFQDALLFLFVYAVVVVVNQYRKKDKKLLYARVGQGHPSKTYLNVLGKVLLPSLASIFGMKIVFLSLLAYGLADSLSSQLGVFSRTQPRLVTSFRLVPAGTNGAVSAFGIILGIVSGVIIGIIYSLMNVVNIKAGLIGGIVGGLVGNLLDSLFGATIEERFKLADWFVNFISGLAVALIVLIFI